MWSGLKRLADQLPELMDIARLPGLAVAAIVDGEVAGARAFGVKSTATGEPVTAGTMFQAGSLGKPLFACAVMQLLTAGALDLDRPLAEYLPAPYDPALPDLALVTARHVLSHSSGLQNWRFTPDDRLQIAFAPGTRFSYSGEEHPAFLWV